MRQAIFSLAFTLVWTGSAACQEFKAVLSSDDFRPGKEITLAIHGGTPPFTFGFGSGFFRGEKLLLKVDSPDERTYRLTVTETLDPTHAKFRTITVEDDAGRVTIARTAPSTPPSQPKDKALDKLIDDLQSPNESVRLQAAKKLGNLGPAARPALSTLRRLLDDPDEDVRIVAIAAIGRIEAERIGDWVKMTLPDKRFEISFPAKPERRDEAFTFEEWKAKVRMVGWELENPEQKRNLGFVVVEISPPKSIESEPARFWFESLQTRALKKGNAKLLSYRDFVLADKYPARDIEFELPGMRLWTRLVHTSAAVYGIHSAGSVEFVNGAEVKRFMESFQTSDAPAQWSPPSGSERIKALIQQLQSPDAFDRLFALREAAKLGPEAKEALPIVERLANEGNPQERAYAQVVLTALRRAQPGVNGGGGGSAGAILHTQGELTTADEKDSVRSDSFRKIIPCKLVGGQTYFIDLVSTEFDAYLRLEDDWGQQLATDDDGGGDRNARIVFRAPRDGVYRMVATTFSNEATGKFVLTVRPANEILNIEGQLTQADGKDTVRTDSHRKVYECRLSAGKLYVIDLRSDELDSYLRLEDDQGTEVAHDDDTGGFPHARINYRAPRDGVYRIIATTYIGGVLGRFTLTVREER